MSIAQAHLDIARERFLELMAAHPNGEARMAALTAIEDAKAFTDAYTLIVYDAPATSKTKGCKACFGSGGKANSPCKACSGTGKVAA